MTKISFHHTGGDVDVLDVPAGTSIMRAAVANGVPGIIGECGGQAMCATCHVYVREEYVPGLPEIGEEEEEMLDCTVDPRDPERSRLGCQVFLSDGNDLEVDVPGQQV